LEAFLTSDIAAEGTVWWCTHCGRIAADKQGKMAALGWTKECTQNAVLVHEETMQLDDGGRVVQAELVDKSGHANFAGKIDEFRIKGGSTKGQSGAN
jgi:hypothetical protein